MLNWPNCSRILLHSSKVKYFTPVVSKILFLTSTFGCCGGRQLLSDNSRDLPLSSLDDSEDRIPSHCQTWQSSSMSAFGVDTSWIKWFICTPLFTFKIHCSVDHALSRGLVCRWLSIGKTAAVLIQVLKEEKGKESNILEFRKLSKKKSRSDLHTWDECPKNKEVNWR